MHANIVHRTTGFKVSITNILYMRICNNLFEIATCNILLCGTDNWNIFLTALERYSEIAVGDSVTEQQTL